MIASGGSGIPTGSMYSRTSGRERHQNTRGRRVAPDSDVESQAQPVGVPLSVKLDEILQAATQQQSFLFSLQEEVRGIGCRLGDLQGTVLSLEDKVQALQQSHGTPESSDSSSVSFSRIPKQLSAKVKVLHGSFADINKFAGEELYSSVHNQKVAEKMIEELRQEFSTLAIHVIRKAVHRYYESRRRIYNDKSTARQEQVAANMKQGKKKSRQRYLFQRRAKQVKKNELKWWKQLTADYMSDESDGDDDVIVRHSLTWRSQELTRFLQKLDKRHEKQGQSGGFKGLERTKGAPSKRLPPRNAPTWTVDPDHSPSSSSLSPETMSEQSTPLRTAQPTRVCLFSAATPEPDSILQELDEDSDSDFNCCDD